MTPTDGAGTAVRRSRFLAISYRQHDLIHLGALLRGEVDVTTEDRPVAASPLTGEEHELTEAELRALARIPSGRWSVPPANGEDGCPDPAIVESLVARGLLLSDAGDERSRELRVREERLAAAGWHRATALFHFMAREGFDGRTLRHLVDLETGELAMAPEEALGFRSWVERHGPPPPTFHHRPDAEETQALPPGGADHPLFDLLARRRTVRLFDRRRSLSLETLAKVLFQVFGCRGTFRVLPELTLIRRSSPSGGALHPIEVYPLVRRVEGLDPGIYHYDVEHHALDRLRRLDEARVEELAERFTAGQGYFATAPVLFVLTARFSRTFWKYRDAQRAYRAVWLDAAHLSQTLYLVATALGLGAFVTAAVTEREVDRELGLDPVEEGAVAICGCGVPFPRDTELVLDVEPFEPWGSAP